MYTGTHTRGPVFYISDEYMRARAQEALISADVKSVSPGHTKEYRYVGTFCPYIFSAGPPSFFAGLFSRN